MDTENLWKVSAYMPPGLSKFAGEEDVLGPGIDSGRGPIAWMWKQKPRRPPRPGRLGRVQLHARGRRGPAGSVPPVLHHAGPHAPLLSPARRWRGATRFTTTCSFPATSFSAGSWWTRPARLSATEPTRGGCKAAISSGASSRWSRRPSPRGPATRSGWILGRRRLRLRGRAGPGRLAQRPDPDGRFGPLCASRFA